MAAGDDRRPIRRTRVLEALEGSGVSFRLLTHSEPVYTVAAAARQRGVALEDMVKSILLRDRDGRYVLGCVTGDAQLEPQAVRAALAGSCKRLYFASSDEVKAVTGCVQGAVAPIGLPADVPVVCDSSIARCRRVTISSGDPMAGIELDPIDLIRLSGAQLAAIARKATRD